MILSSPLIKAVFHRGKCLRLTIMMANVTLGMALISTSSIEAIVLQNPSNGHFYEFVPGYLTWPEARDAAASRNHLGLPGYLATITSQSEQAFIEQLLDGVSIPPIDDFPQIWIGGSDADQEGLWKWMTGPEAGTPFWQGDFTGSPVGGAYENWETLEGVRRQPDGEHFLAIEFNPTPGSFPSDETYQWNDSNADRIGVGYVVEYSEGGVGGTVTGLRPALIVCENLSTSQVVVIWEQQTSWNCETAGLEVAPDDIIRITLVGGAQ